MSDCDVCIGTSDYDEADFSRVSLRKARVGHTCCECRGKIEPGTTYERAVLGYDAEMYSFKTCALCVEIRTAFCCGGGWLFECLWDDMEEGAFPELTTASNCFVGLSSAAKQFVIDRWNKWKFGRNR